MIRASAAIAALGAVAGAVSLAGCMPPPAPVPVAAGPAPIPFHCPVPGTVAVFGSAGRPLTYTGPELADPLVCRAITPDGRTLRRIANLIEPPPGQGGVVRNGLAPLFPIAPGKAVQFSYLQTYQDGHTPADRFVERWTTDGVEEMQVGGMPVQAVRFTREIDNPQPGGHQPDGGMGVTWHLWFAPATGVWVKGEPTLLRGKATSRAFMAERVAVPQGQVPPGQATVPATPPAAVLVR